MQKYFKKIDFVFYNEGKIRQAVLESREDCQRPELRNGSGISDPTARDAIRNLTPIPSVTIGDLILEFPESWLEVIDKTCNWCKRQSQTHFESVRKKYLGENYRKICRDLNISLSNFFSMIKTARQYAALQAVQRRLIFIN